MKLDTFNIMAISHYEHTPFVHRQSLTRESLFAFECLSNIFKHCSTASAAAIYISGAHSEWGSRLTRPAEGIRLEIALTASPPCTQMAMYR